MGELSREEILRYSRHLMIPEVGLDGQRKLHASAVLVVGTGGLGSPVSLYLAAAGVGRIGLVDFDEVESSNLQRQIIHGTSRVGDLKVESARDRLLDLNPFVQVDAYAEALDSANANEIAEPYELIVDCTDNFPTRYLINDLCVLTGKPLVYGSIFRFEGQVSVFDAKRGPCYRCLFPAPPPPGLVQSCADGGVFGVLPGVIGALQATEAIKLLLGIGDPLIGTLMLYDAMDSSFQKINLRKNPKCRVCSPEADVHQLIDYPEFCGVNQNDSHSAGLERDITPLELAERIHRGEKLILLDVREPVEQQVSMFPGAVNIPFGQLASRMAELNREDEIVLYCRTGVRSARALAILAAAGFTHVSNLRSGINGWARDVDPTMLQY
jgi:sulfur-carrier protein adenylyltransferase/sulfurtransferase